jgi:ABC-type multidrug transport system fused ATPase/permease subunit
MRSILRCWRLISPSLRRLWLWQIPLGAVAAGLDVVTGVLLLRAAGAFTDGIRGSSHWGAGPMLAVLAILVLAKTGVRLYDTARREACAEATVAEVAERLLRFWMGSSLRRQLDSTPTQRIDDVQFLATEVGREGINSLVLFWSEGLVVAGLLGLLFASAPLPALAVLGLCGGGAVFTLRFSHQRHGRGVAALAPARIRVQSMVQDCIKSSREIRLHGRIDDFARSYRDRRAVFGAIWTELECWKSVPLVANEALFLFGMLGLLAFSDKFSSGGNSAAPLLMLFLYAGLRMLPAMNRLVYRGLALRAARPSADRVTALLGEIPAALPRRPEPIAAPGPTFHRITLTDASFTYPDRSTQALAGISLEVRAGEKLALIGPSGGGKSTVLLLLAGLLAPDRGAVEADGSPLAVDDPIWHRQLGFVAQDALMLEDTVQANIALGLEPGAIDEAALSAAVSLAQLTAVMAGLPQGLETRLVNSGRELSGGQRQRIALARELYRRPSLLLLDEATAFVDQPVEQQIFAGLTRERPDLTVVFVTHRLATLSAADRVAWIAGGRLQACGTLAELSGHAGFQAFLASAESPAEAE